MKRLLFSKSYENPNNTPLNAFHAVTRYLLPDSLPKWAGVTLLFFVASWVGVALGQVTSTGADIVWPANGLLLAFLLKMPRRYWFSYLAGSVFASVAIHEIYPFPVMLPLLFSLSNVLEIVLAAILLTGRNCKRIDLNDFSFMAAFTFFGVGIPALTATVFVQITEACLSMQAGLVSLLNFFIGDALGLAITTPLVLSLEREKIATLLSRRRRFETLAILSCLMLLSMAVFAQEYLPVAFVLFPVLLLAVFRLGSLGATLGLFLVVVPAVCFTALRKGPFSLVYVGSLTNSIFLLQGFLIVATVTTFGASAALTNRERLRLELDEAFREAHADAAQDHTTGLANRRTFDKQLALEWRRALRDHTPLSLLMLDVDLFKLYNDHYGHLAGDGCLRSVAEILSKSPLRASDLVARYGGEEFVVLLPRAELKGATIMADLIRQSIVDSAMPHVGNLSGIVTISAGVATMRPTDGVRETALIERADAALYRAKDEGRNQIWFEKI